MDKELIRSYTLQNAIRYKGKASAGAVIGRILSGNPSLRDNVQELSKEIAQVIKEVNKMSLSEQRKLLEKQAPELLKKRHSKKKDIFAFLGIKGGVVTAFPPEPSKYPHIGHAKAALMNYELAKAYNGRFILRFEDTNPKLARKEFYQIHLDNYSWLGIEPDLVDYASDHMQRFYEFARKLLRQGHAYVCSCAQEKVKHSREKGIPCACRSADEQIKRFRDMETRGEGECILRLKIDLKHKNSTMRDPTIMRVIEEKHPRTRGKFKLWPNYDFENAVMDGIEGVTHRLRTKEFEMRNELQRHIQSLLGFHPTMIFEFARFNLEGVESSGRVIREKIACNELTGWDDPSLTTLVALRRRGFTPGAIKNFVMSTGLSKAEATLTWDDLIVHNKRLLDKECNRYFFVCNPVEVTVKGAPAQEVSLKLHPEFKERGLRKFFTGERFYIAESDFKSIKVNRLYRLMDCLNFRKTSRGFVFDSLELDKYKEKGEGIIHWLPSSDELIPVFVLMPDHRIKAGLAEPGVKDLKQGVIIQFERFGFCRLDNQEKMLFWFTH